MLLPTTKELSNISSLFLIVSSPLRIVSNLYFPTRQKFCLHRMRSFTWWSAALIGISNCAEIWSDHHLGFVFLALSLPSSFLSPSDAPGYQYLYVQHDQSNISHVALAVLPVLEIPKYSIVGAAGCP